VKPRCSVFIATSLDGFIAREDGSIDWLNLASAAASPGEDYGYAAFFATVDALVMGRKTFEQVLTFEPWPYGETPLVVMSRTLSAPPPGAPPAVSVTAEAPTELVARLSDAGCRRIYVDGGATIRSFVAAGLIDDMTITVIPVLLGAGRPLFGPLPSEAWLALESSKAYPSGLVQLVYRAKWNS